MNIVSSTGNCVSASIPLALVMAYNNKIISKNDLIYFIGTGAGLSIASALLRL